MCEIGARKRPSLQTMNNEVWRPFPLAEGRYEVSNKGQVQSIPHIEARKDGRTVSVTGRIIKQGEHYKGYKRVQLRIDGKPKSFFIHRVVAMAFIPNPNGLPEVNHIDEDKKNNNAANLEWCTHLENSRHGTRGARIGETHKRLNIKGKPVAQYTTDGELIKAYPSGSEAARQTGFSQGNIWSAVHSKKVAYGYVWKYA